MSISKIRENARVALTGKWGKGACITLAYLAFAFAVGFIIGLFGEESLIGQLIDLAYSIFQVPIAFGLAYAFIKLKRNEEVKAFDYLNLGFSNFGRSWKIGLREVLKVILPMILMIISIAILAFAGVSMSLSILGATTDLASTENTSVGLLLVGLILFIVSTIWFTVRSLLYSLTAYVAYDNPNMSSLEVVNESERMMKGNRGKIFLLSLSFIGWAILATFTFGIGYIWLLPYMMVAEVCFYEHLLGKNETSNSENNVDAITEM